MEAAATPFPSEETTPPVTKMYFGAERKGLDFLRKESAYSTLWSQWRRVSNHVFNFYFDAIRRVNTLRTVLRLVWPACGYFAGPSRNIFSTRSTSAGTSTLTLS